MKVNVAFHNVDHSDALEAFIQKKSQLLKRLLWNSEHFDWVVEKDSQGFKPVLHLKLAHKNIKVDSHAENAFKAVNAVIDKAKRLVKKDHRK